MISILFLTFLTIYLISTIGKTQFHDKRIVGGKPSKSTLWPMIVSIRQQNLQETLKSMRIPYISKSGHFCSGTLISSKWVLTAASCFLDEKVQNLLQEGRFTLQKARELLWLMRNLVQRMNLNNYYVCLTEDCSVRRSIENIILHPSYMVSIGRNKPGYDLALVKLGQPVDNYISDLLPSANVINLSENCKTAGWGVTNLEDFESSGHFREFDVKLVSKNYCRPIIKSLEICGVGKLIGNQRSDFCFFDTGGPLMCKEDSNEGRWKLYGLISRDLKNDCGDPDQKGVYTNLMGYNRWINSIIN